MADTNPPPNYTLIYFKLSYVCPKTWRFRRSKGLVGFKGFLNPRISIFFGTKVFLFVLSTYCILLVDVSKGRWLVNQSTPPGSAPEGTHDRSCKMPNPDWYCCKFNHLHIDGLIYPIILSEILGSKDNSQSTKIS